MKPPAFVFFDLDGVLIDSEPHHALAERGIFADVSAGRLTGPDFDTTGTSIRAMYEALVRSLGLPLDPAALARRHFTDTFCSIESSREGPMPGLMPLLHALDRAGVPCAVVSSSSRGYVECVLDHLGIAARFRFCVCGDEVAHAKPAPELYQRALALAGVAAANAVAIEDSSAGVTAANGASIRAIGLCQRRGQDLSHAFATVPTLFDVPRLLRLDGPGVFVIPPSLSGRTVRAVLEQELLLSRSRIRQLKLREAGILLNGARTYVTATVRVGDVLNVDTGDDPDRMYAKPRGTDPPIPVLYEDGELLIIDKPAGLAVHAAGRGADEVTIESALAAVLPAGKNPHPVTRLDRGTTGAMVIAKSGYMHDRLRRIQHTDAFAKEYRGVAVGRVLPPAGTVDAPIGFAEGSRLRRAVAPEGQAAVTQYETLAASEHFTLLRLIPVTGRTHQLRVHMAHLGHPLAGDFLYGMEDPQLIARPALHAYRVRLVHPLTGETISVTAPLPPDMERLIQP